MAVGNILITFTDNGKMRVDFNGDKNSMFKLDDVDLLRAMMAVESMMVSQTGMDIALVRELLDDERLESKVKSLKQS